MTFLLKVVVRNASAKKQTQLIPCTVVFYNKGGTIEWAGWLPSYQVSDKNGFLEP